MDGINNAWKSINNPHRSRAIDVYRAIAVLSVVAFHFGPFLPYGYLGVDIFFVISGFLVGGILIEQYLHKKIHFWKFILQRGFKIWPSYYFFLLIGGIFCYLYYSGSSHPDLYIPLHDIKRYLFFYRNFTGEPHHWNFDHVWSLCIEEHFYILFPLSLIFTKFFPFQKKTKIYILLFLYIVSGIAFKWLALNFTNGKDTYAATYNRLDALAYGVLLYMMLHYPLFKSIFKKQLWFWIGMLGAISCILFDHFVGALWFEKLWFHSLIPLFVVMIIYATYHFAFPYTKGLRFLSYYSYNWYLWHPMLVYMIYDHIGNNIIGFAIYLGLSFLLAFVFTHGIEEPFMKLRRTYIDNMYSTEK